jgi:phosphocarrier protein
MNEPAGAHGAASAPAEGGQPVVRVVEICNKKGLHARASAKFVQMVEEFDAVVKVKRGNEIVGGNSIMGLMMLAAGPGTTITIEATGKDAADAIEALAKLVTSGFGEHD